MIWEVDDDLDLLVCWDEFLVMYQRCISDKTGLEPCNLYNLVRRTEEPAATLRSFAVRRSHRKFPDLYPLLQHVEIRYFSPGHDLHANVRGMQMK